MQLKRELEIIPNGTIAPIRFPDTIKNSRQNIKSRYLKALLANQMKVN